MNTSSLIELSEQTERSFADLEQRLQDLMMLCDKLLQDKTTLQAKINDLHAERESLIEQHRQSRARIDAMVARFNGSSQQE